MEISILIPTKNEEKNIGFSLESVVGWADEIVLVDSQSTDDTLRIADEMGIQVVQFHYDGGWPKKRQWALDNYHFKNDWILLLDADEALTPELKAEIERELPGSAFNGYWIRLNVFFLGRELRFGDSKLWKLCLFRKGAGRYEERLSEQDVSMADMEVHEHVIVAGEVGRLGNSIVHNNYNSLDRYIQKHNEYSNWEAAVYTGQEKGTIRPRFWGNQAERRRWLKKTFLNVPGSPIIFFIYRYILKLGFLDGKQGFLYALMQTIHIFHIKIKIFEKILRFREVAGSQSHGS